MTICCLSQTNQIEAFLDSILTMARIPLACNNTLWRHKTRQSQPQTLELNFSLKIRIRTNTRVKIQVTIHNYQEISLWGPRRIVVKKLRSSLRSPL